MDSIKTIIIKHLESEYGDKWCFAGKIEDYIRNLLGSKASNASRRCRELERSGILEKQLVQVDGVGPRVVQYRVTKQCKTYEGKYRFTTHEPGRRCPHMAEVPIRGTIDSKTEVITFKQNQLKI